MERMLVALDDTPHASIVLAGAGALARKTGAKMVLFHAVSVPPSVPAEAMAVRPDAVGPMLEQQARERLERHAADLSGELVASVRVTVGTPWQSICRAALEEQVALIVIGAHRYGFVDRVLGTTAAKVVNHADRTVVVVRAPDLLG